MDFEWLISGSDESGIYGGLEYCYSIKQIKTRSALAWRTKPVRFDRAVRCDHHLLVSVDRMQGLRQIRGLPHVRTSRQCFARWH